MKADCIASARLWKFDTNANAVVINGAKVTFALHPSNTHKLSRFWPFEFQSTLLDAGNRIGTSFPPLKKSGQLLRILQNPSMGTELSFKMM